MIQWIRKIIHRLLWLLGWGAILLVIVVAHAVRIWLTLWFVQEP